MASLKWAWQYSATNGKSPLAHGRLWTNVKRNEDGYYLVKEIKGRRDGVKIDSLLPAGTSIPGNVDTITGQPYPGDNRIRPQSTKPDRPQLTGSGIIFSLNDGSYSNLFYATNPPISSNFEFHSASPYPNGVVPPNTESLIGFEARIIT